MSLTQLRNILISTLKVKRVVLLLVRRGLININGLPRAVLKGSVLVVGKVADRPFLRVGVHCVWITASVAVKAYCPSCCVFIKVVA